MLGKPLRCRLGAHAYEYEDKQTAGMAKIQDAECPDCGTELLDVIVTPDMERLNREGET